MTHCFTRYLVAISLALSVSVIAAEKAARQPNIVFILADDIGYGDLGCYGATKVKTPNVDRLAREGLRFTDAHATASVCSPTRYAFITGQYAWRSPGKAIGVLPGNAPLTIDTRTVTTPEILRRAGYTTGVVGKWHLGLGGENVDWNGEIKPGPLEIGFDYAFIMPATGDRVPCVYVENHRVAGLDPNDPIRISYQGKIGDDPTGREHPELLKMKLSMGHADTIVNGISRIGFMTGGKSARWNDETMADTYAEKAIAFIERNQSKPFFLYLATHDIHVPRVPNPRFKGTSECGVRGDAIQEFDDTVGKIVSALDRLKLSENTMLIVTSDNGGVIDDGYADGAKANLNGHKPNGDLRAGKGSYYEGGTREPFIVRWPGRIKPGVSDQLIGHVDMLASFAALAGKKLPKNAGPDSYNVLPALLGEAGTKPVRDHLVLQRNVAERLAIRQGSWKLIIGTQSDAPKKKNASDTELYDLASDPGETVNLAEQQPERVKPLAELLQRIKSAPASRALDRKPPGRG